MELPKFKYHPNPLQTGSIEQSNEECEVCKQKRGYISTTGIYAIENVDNICPWCIADGSAAKKYNGEFVAGVDNPEILSETILDELFTRTVSFSSFQEEMWLTHCNDACEFHGLAKTSDVKKISEEEIQSLVNNSSLTREEIKGIQQEDDNVEQHYLFKFVCRHCDKIRLLEDLD